MTNGNLTKQLITFTIPLILSGLLQQLYSWVDAFIVGNFVGEHALAAIGVTSSITNMLIMIMTGFVSGVSILSAQYYGKSNTAIQKNIISTFLCVLGVCFTLLALCSIFFANTLLELLNTPTNIFEDSISYLRIILLGIPFLCVYNTYASVLRGIGNSKVPFYSILVSSITNVLLDILFVCVFHLDIAGVAMATVLSQIVMTIFIITYAITHYDFLVFPLNKTMIHLPILKEGFHLALPITVQSLVSSAGNLVLQNFLNGFGTSMVAAISTAYRIDTMIMLPLINLGTGIATITAQNIGAKKYDRVKEGLGIGIRLSALVSIILTIVVISSSKFLIGLFGVSAATTQLGVEFFSRIALFYIIYAIAMVYRGFLEGQRYVMFSAFSGITALFTRIILSYVFRPMFAEASVAYAEIVSWFVLLSLLAWKARRTNLSHLK